MNNNHELLHLARTVDLFAAIERISLEPDPEHAAALFGELAKDPIRRRRDLDAGLDAARLNLRLARELQRGPLAESRGHWLVGAHRLARGEDDAAITEFSRARERALDAADRNNELLNTGYAALIGVLGGEAEAQTEFSGVVERLRSTPGEDAPFFAEQLEKALAVFRATRECTAP